MSRPTLCSYSTLSQAQPQTIGFNPPPPPPLGCQVNMWRYHGLLFMVSIALVDARKTSLTGVQNSKKNWLAATQLGHQNSKKIGSWMMLRIVVGSTPPPPPWKKARSAPVEYTLCYTSSLHGLGREHEQYSEHLRMILSPCRMKPIFLVVGHAIKREF